jgi:hypothetical protein
MMLQPSPLQVPGTETWAERYGPIGVVALLAIAALILALRQFLKERSEDRTRIEVALKREALLNDKIVEIVRENHRETLALTEELNTRHEVRYQALLERTMQENRTAAEALRAREAASTEIMRSLLSKAKGTQET